MGLLRHIIGLVIAVLVLALSAAAMPMAPTASHQAEFSPYHQAALAEHADIYFTAPAPPMAVAIAAQGGNTGVANELTGVAAGAAASVALTGKGRWIQRLFSRKRNATNAGLLNPPTRDIPTWRGSGPRSGVIGLNSQSASN